MELKKNKQSGCFLITTRNIRVWKNTKPRSGFDVSSVNLELNETADVDAHLARSMMMQSIQCKLIRFFLSSSLLFIRLPHGDVMRKPAGAGKPRNFAYLDYGNLKLSFEFVNFFSLSSQVRGGGFEII